MTHTELNLRERRTIEEMLNAKIPVREIAAEIGRHVSTVYREIKRNHYDDKELAELNGYYGVVAQRAASQRRARRRKLVRLVSLRNAVIKQLREGWSPEQIAGRLQFEGQTLRVSHERPDYIDIRETFGEWEGDLMIFERAQGKMNVASLVERKTRFAVHPQNWARHGVQTCDLGARQMAKTLRIKP